jgi:hypothetical protein
VSRKSYVDRKIAELDLLDQPLSQQASSSALHDGEEQPSSTASGLVRTRQPAGVGKLLEIDLGPNTTLENIMRTAAAQKRLETGEPEALPAKPARKPRLGRDGKPWRPRKGRNEDDVKRDQLVEAILRESKRTLQNIFPLHLHYHRYSYLISGHIRRARDHGSHRRRSSSR